MSQRLQGNGKVFKGTRFVAYIRYEIQITSVTRPRALLIASTGVLLGRDIRLRINPTDNIVSFLGEQLTLHLKRSRRLAFVVSIASGKLLGF